MRYFMKKFEDLTNSQLYEMLKLRQDIFIIEQACIYPELDNKDQGAYHLMAFDAQRMVGCLRILDRGVSYEEASIGRVVVSESLRGKGIAKEMMQRALAFLKNERGEQGARISAQSYTIPFYQGVGFEVVSGEYDEDGIPHVEMFCDLK